MARGLLLQDFDRMSLGMILDFVAEYDEEEARANRAAKRPGSKQAEETQFRRATQADFDQFTGR
jgi:hypothetical protein